MQPISFDVQPPQIVAPGEWSEVLFSGVDRGHAWDLNRANVILRNALLHQHAYRRIFALPINAENRKLLLQRAPVGELPHKGDNMPPVDPHVPILLVQLFGRHFVIDGLARAQDAIDRGWTALPAYLMTRFEEYSCRVCPCCRPEHHLARVVREAREAGQLAC